MDKKVEFHQAQITVVVRVVDDTKSYGTQNFSTSILLNTDAEWVDARKKIDATIKQLQERMDGDSD